MILNLTATRQTSQDLVLSYEISDQGHKLADVNYIVPLGYKPGRSPSFMVCGAGHWHFEGCNAEGFLAEMKRKIVNDFCVRAKDLVLH